jgi:hypothetical protein
MPLPSNAFGNVIFINLHCFWENTRGAREYPRKETIPSRKPLLQIFYEILKMHHGENLSLSLFNKE